MKRLLMILLSVMVLTVAGCSNSEDISTETSVGYEETIETAEQTETLVAESEETEITEKEAETAEYKKQQAQLEGERSRNSRRSRSGYGGALSVRRRCERRKQ